MVNLNWFAAKLFGFSLSNLKFVNSTVLGFELLLPFQ